MNLAARRLLAFAVDYAVIVCYIVVLGGVSLLVLASPAGREYQSLWAGAWTAELIGFGMLTAPVVLYFALLEGSAAGATLGKRTLRLRVRRVGGSRLTLPRSLLRSAIKFLPWELAHFVIWQYVYGARTGVVPSWAPVALVAVYGAVAVYLVSLFIGGDHRTIYDRAAGSVVTAQPRAQSLPAIP